VQNSVNFSGRLGLPDYCPQNFKKTEKTACIPSALFGLYQGSASLAQNLRLVLRSGKYNKMLWKSTLFQIFFKITSESKKS